MTGAERRGLFEMPGRDAPKEREAPWGGAMDIILAGLFMNATLPWRGSMLNQTARARARRRQCPWCARDRMKGAVALSTASCPFHSKCL